MPELENKEFMTPVVPIHCGDPLGKQQANTKFGLRNVSSQNLVIERIHAFFGLS